MVAVKAKSVVKLKIEASCPTHSRTDVLVRDIDFTIDEPKERGGTNFGPSPTETMIAALTGCTNVITNKIAQARGLKIARIDIDAEASFDRRGVMLAEEVEVPFPDILLRINVTTDADPAAFDAVKRDLEKFCPVSKVIRKSGTKITEEWSFTKPS